MRKIPLIIIALFAKILSSFAQAPAPDDSSHYKERKLKVEEINFVSGYYHQDGNHSAVTGGIGTENLTDIANTIDLKLSKLNSKGNKHSLSFEMGIDTYTSASSDNITPLTGPSRQDTRLYPSLSYNIANPKKGISLGGGVSYSHEYDYVSRGLNVSFIKSSKDNNRELGMTLFAYFDGWTAIYPYELRPPGYGTGSERDSLDILPRNSYQASFTFSQVINERMQFALLFDPSYQEGQLTTLYQRVYFNDNSERVEKLPAARFKIAAAVRANYFLSDRFIIRAYYRFYHDDWGNTAHTANIEIPVKLTPFFSLSPFYRFSVQSGIDYFAPYKEHSIDEAFYTSDYDLSPFNSHFIGSGIRLAPPKGVFGLRYWNSVELRYGHYIRSTDLIANSITLALKLK
jgi:hypothetical protein